MLKREEEMIEHEDTHSVYLYQALGKWNILSLHSSAPLRRARGSAATLNDSLIL
jgi:hypothetical protein